MWFCLLSDVKLSNQSRSGNPSGVAKAGHVHYNLFSLCGEEGSKCVRPNLDVFVCNGRVHVVVGGEGMVSGKLHACYCDGNKTLKSKAGDEKKNTTPSSSPSSAHVVFNDFPLLLTSSSLSSPSFHHLG